MNDIKLLKDVIEKPISGEWGVEGETVKVLRTTNFTNEGKLDFNNVVNRNVDEKKRATKRLVIGDIIIEKSGGSPKQPVGRVVIFEKEGEYLCNNFTSILRPKKNIIYPKYLLYFLFANHKYGFVNAFQNKTTGIINLKLIRYINEVKIPLPPLKEQKKIAAILDQADFVRKKIKAIIEKYDELAQSLFLDMFGDPVRNPKGWKIVTIRELVYEVKYGTSSKAVEGGKYKYLRMNNVTYKGYMDYTNLKYIDMSDEQKHKYIVRNGDVIFNRTNSKELVGKTGIIQTDEEQIIAGYLIRVRTNELANPYYIWAHLNSRWAKLTLNNMCKNIVGMANINAQELQKIKILKPPIKLQNQFEKSIKEIEKQKTQAEASLQKSEDLFNSLLQKAFKGELKK